MSETKESLLTCTWSGVDQVLSSATKWLLNYHIITDFEVKRFLFENLMNVFKFFNRYVTTFEATFYIKRYFDYCLQYAAVVGKLHFTSFIFGHKFGASFFIVYSI